MIGKGVYTLAEAARFASIHPQRVRSWFKARDDSTGLHPVFQSDYKPISDDYAISFLDLIDVLVAGRFRESGVSMHMVRQSRTILAKELDTCHPFCHRNLYTDGSRVFCFVADEINDQTLHEVISRQQFFRYIQSYLEHVDYSNTTKIAKRWRITQGVVLDPAIHLGKPTVEGTGVTTYIINAQYQANNRDASLVADLYEISEKDVQNAVAFETGIAA